MGFLFGTALIGYRMRRGADLDDGHLSNLFAYLPALVQIVVQTGDSLRGRFH